MNLPPTSRPNVPIGAIAQHAAGPTHGPEARLLLTSKRVPVERAGVTGHGTPHPLPTCASTGARGRDGSRGAGRGRRHSRSGTDAAAAEAVDALPAEPPPAQFEEVGRSDRAEVVPGFAIPESPRHVPAELERHGIRPDDIANDRAVEMAGLMPVDRGRAQPMAAGVGAERDALQKLGIDHGAVAVDAGGARLHGF